MLRAMAYFAEDNGLGVDDLLACNLLIIKDLGEGDRLNSGRMPDLLMVAREENNHVAGVLALRFTEGTRAWEILFVSAIGRYKHESMMKFLIDAACSSIRIRYGGQHRSWMVRRVRMVDEKERDWLQSLGFVKPDKWVKHVLCDEGFVAFDPFDQILMKRPIGV